MELIRSLILLHENFCFNPFHSLRTFIFLRTGKPEDQGAAVYKKNKVKQRTEHTDKGYIKTIYTYYDEYGNPVEIKKIDNNNDQDTRMVFDYDDQYRCRRTVSYPYRYTDNVTGARFPFPVTDSNYIYITDYAYSKSGMLLSTTEKRSTGELYSRNTYSYEPFVQTEQFFVSGKVNTETKMYYSGGQLMKKRERRSEGQIWIYNYAYQYDRSGRVIEANYSIKYSASDKSYLHINFPVPTVYEYDQNGLMVKYTYYYKKTPPWVHTFSYEYRE